MQVRDGQNCCKFSLHDEEDAERKPAENRSPKLLKDDRKPQRSFLDSCKRCAEFSEEFRSEGLSFAVVP